MTTPASIHVLDVYDLAYLAGGPARVVDTAVVSLVRSGRVRVPSPGRLATVDSSRRHPVETAVLDAVGPVGHRSFDTVRWRLLDDDRLLEIGRRLRERGLLARRVAVPGLRAIRRGPTPTRAGRRTLAAAQPPHGVDAEVMRVALDGRSAMLDTTVRTAVFEPRRTTHEVPRPRHRSPHGFRDDPRIAAHRAGTASWGGIGSGGFDGVVGGVADTGGGDGG